MKLSKTLNAEMLTAILFSFFSVCSGSCVAQDKAGLQQCNSTYKSQMHGDLVLNAYKYVTGYDSEFNQMAGGAPPFEALLNSCYAGKLPANCSWSGPESTKYIDLDLSNCPNDAAHFNSRLASISKNNVPANSLVTSFDFQSGFMLSPYGPYREKVLIKYRTYVCSRIYKPADVKGAVKATAIKVLNDGASSSDDVDERPSEKKH